MKIGIIYRYLSLLTGKSYIGQTIDPERRRASHRLSAYLPQTKFARGLNEEGWENFEYSEIYSCAVDELDAAERYYIELYNSVVSGYNTVHPKKQKPNIRDSGRWVLKSKNRHRIAAINELCNSDRLEIREYNKSYKKSHKWAITVGFFNDVKNRRNYADPEIQKIMPEVTRILDGFYKTTEAMAACLNQKETTICVF